MLLFQHTAARRRLVGNQVRLGVARDVSTHSRPKAAGAAKSQSATSCPFQHTAARRRLGSSASRFLTNRPFQHTAARRRLVQPPLIAGVVRLFQHTAARRRLGLKLAVCTNGGFNTQPPEGGWVEAAKRLIVVMAFQHTAARRRLDYFCGKINHIYIVSTHSRPKAAGFDG